MEKLPYLTSRCRKGAALDASSSEHIDCVKNSTEKPGPREKDGLVNGHKTSLRLGESAGEEGGLFVICEKFQFEEVLCCCGFSSLFAGCLAMLWVSSSGVCSRANSVKTASANRGVLLPVRSSSGTHWEETAGDGLTDVTQQLSPRSGVTHISPHDAGGVCVCVLCVALRQKEESCILHKAQSLRNKNWMNRVS